jgi:hypothetical protein
MVASPRTDKACDDVWAGQGDGGSSFQHWQALSTHHVHVQLRHPTFQAHLHQVLILLDALKANTKHPKMIIQYTVCKLGLL